MKSTTFGRCSIACATAILVSGASLPSAASLKSADRQRGTPVPQAAPSTAIASDIAKLRAACAREEKLLAGVPVPVVVAMAQREKMGTSDSAQLVTRALESTATMHKASVMEERTDLDIDARKSSDNARKYPAEAPFWNWNRCIDAARLTQLQASAAAANAQLPDDPIAAGGGGATLGTQPVTPTITPVDAVPIVNATFADIQKLLAAEGPRLNLGTTFKATPELDAVATVTAGLTSAEQLQIHLIAMRAPEGSVRLVVYPRYRGSYVNLSQAQDATALMRMLLSSNTVSGPCVYLWGIDQDGDIFHSCVLASESFPYASIVVALRDIRIVDRAFGEWRQLLKAGKEIK